MTKIRDYEKTPTNPIGGGFLLTVNEIRDLWANLPGQVSVFKLKIPEHATRTGNRLTPFGACPILSYAGAGWVLIHVSKEQLEKFLWKHGDDGEMEFDGLSL